MSETSSPRAARSRQKILDAATDLLVDSGPRSVTVDAVAEASGVAKSTLYRHWPSRDDLLVDVVRCNLPDIEPLDLSVGFAAALRHIVRAAATAFEDPGWSRIFPAMASLRVSMPELNAFVEDDVSAKKQAFTAILDLGVAEGALPGPLDVDDVVNVLIGPLAFAAMTGKGERVVSGGLVELADYVVERFIASYQNATD